MGATQYALSSLGTKNSLSLYLFYEYPCPVVDLLVFAVTTYLVIMVPLTVSNF
ncbi:hypothetical protein ASPZODRAFT_127649 [Penicilliopsis zonata CBS 506.65]|uniref:Uncharacterized protein n=1 Tax=Penicilliopsis zonata CBS 506.65 TaxID=1073090 RepID=A0A1L9SWK9_9EURO|nr:hypothetical protein ASPZODRAFT_127649 [Penicilliopsis zonata CBS 506.65]OJJ51556.1 hypothetical protein ASPZODRAFT_127649 [Penicilliopsis zonata CBS 506.65]